MVGVPRGWSTFSRQFKEGQRAAVGVMEGTPQKLQRRPRAPGARRHEFWDTSGRE